MPNLSFKQKELRLMSDALNYYINFTSNDDNEKIALRRCVEKVQERLVVKTVVEVVENEAGTQ